MCVHVVIFSARSKLLLFPATACKREIIALCIFKLPGERISIQLNSCHFTVNSVDVLPYSYAASGFFFHLHFFTYDAPWHFLPQHLSHSYNHKIFVGFNRAEKSHTEKLYGLDLFFSHVNFSQVAGIKGMFLANKKIDNQVKTFITYNKGRDWNLLQAPDTDLKGNPVHCLLVSIWGDLRCTKNSEQSFSAR